MIKTKSQTAFTLLEMILVMAIITFVGGIVFYGLHNQHKTAAVKSAHGIITQLIQLTQTSSQIPLLNKNISPDLQAEITKIKARFLICIDENNPKSYLSTIAIIQGYPGNWRLIQPLISLPDSVYFEIRSLDANNTMHMNLDTLNDNEGPLWFFYEFNSSGHLSNDSRYLGLYQGMLSKHNGKASIQKNSAVLHLYINSLGQVYKLDELNGSTPNKYNIKH